MRDFRGSAERGRRAGLAYLSLEGAQLGSSALVHDHQRVILVAALRQGGVKRLDLLHGHCLDQLGVCMSRAGGAGDGGASGVRLGLFELGTSPCMSRLRAVGDPAKAYRMAKRLPWQRRCTRSPWIASGCAQALMVKHQRTGRDPGRLQHRQSSMSQEQGPPSGVDAAGGQRWRQQQRRRGGGRWPSS